MIYEQNKTLGTGLGSAAARVNRKSKKAGRKLSRRVRGRKKR